MGLPLLRRVPHVKRSERLKARRTYHSDIDTSTCTEILHQRLKYSPVSLLFLSVIFRKLETIFSIPDMIQIGLFTNNNVVVNCVTFRSSWKETSVRRQAILRGFMWFPPAFAVRCQDTMSNRPEPFPSMSFGIHCSPLILHSTIYSLSYSSLIKPSTNKDIPL